MTNSPQNVCGKQNASKHNWDPGAKVIKCTLYLLNILVILGQASHPPPLWVWSPIKSTISLSPVSCFLASALPVLLQAPVPFINPQSAFSLDLLAAALPTSVLYWGWGERGWEGTPLPCQLHNPILLALFPLSNLETSLCLPPDPGQSDVQHSITAESPAGQRCS